MNSALPRHRVWLAAPLVGRNTALCAEGPCAIFRAKGAVVELVTATGGQRLAGNPFDLLREHLGHFARCTAIGYFGYDLKNHLETLPATAVDDLGLPDCWFGFYENAETVTASLPSAPRPCAVPAQPILKSNFTRAAYDSAVQRAKDYIAAGDIYQVNLAQRFQCEVAAAPEAVFAALQAANPAPYSAFLDLGDAQIHSCSPECFLHLRDREVVTRPIKGTRARGSNAAGDERIAAELLASPKDNAELVMITDLERNDLGRVCEFGSVHVSELVRVEQYATVHHLVSTVTGRLRPDVTHLGCVRACFPGGSITGAPKIRAMQIIDELEPHTRGVYTGAIGFFAPGGVSQFNIAIRTVVQQGPRLTFHAGGGIVADSEPAAEYAETLAKAQGIINAIEALRLR